MLSKTTSCLQFSFLLIMSQGFEKSRNRPPTLLCLNNNRQSLKPKSILRKKKIAVIIGSRLSGYDTQHYCYINVLTSVVKRIIRCRVIVSYRAVGYCEGVTAVTP